MKVLVTGGAGFIGSHIVDRLIQQNCHVTVVDNLSTGSSDNVNQKARFINLDILSSELLSVFAAERFDYVIHQAAQTAVPLSLDRPDYDCQVNIQGLVNVLEACRKTGVRRIVFASSAAVYGNVGQIPVPESAPAQPASFYGLSKLAGERYLDMYSKVFGLEYVALRYANVYGERQGDRGEGGVVSIFSRLVRDGQALVIYGDGNQTRDFIYAGDVADANIKALISRETNRVYNVGAMTEVSVNQLAELFARVSGKMVDKRYEAPRTGDIYRSSLSNEAAVRDLGWLPATALPEGLERTYRYVCASCRAAARQDSSRGGLLCQIMKIF